MERCNRSKNSNEPEVIALPFIQTDRIVTLRYAARDCKAIMGVAALDVVAVLLLLLLLLLLMLTSLLLVQLGQRLI